MTKNELRAAQKLLRSAIPPDEKKELDRAIVEHLLSSDLFRDASVLLLFVPLEGEVGILPLAREARKLGKPIAFPRCDRETTSMRFYYLSADERLTPGAYGIPEPPDGAALCEPDESALCVLPGLSFDAYGNRLGYGKGYYDRYLASYPGRTVGAVYDALTVEEVPTDAYDIPAQWIVTEKGLFPALPRSGDPDPDAESGKDSGGKAPRGGKLGAFWRKTVQPAGKKLGAYFADAFRESGGVKAPVAPPLLALTVFLLLILARAVDGRFLDRGSAAVGTSFLLLLIFLVPAVLYCRLQGEKFFARIRPRPVRPEHFPFLLFILVVMLSGGMLCDILTGNLSASGYTLYGTFSARTGGGAAEILAAILAYAILPALCEEIVFRAIFCIGYEHLGSPVAIVVSALFYAMLPFSFAGFPTYFVLGLLLATSAYATRSLVAPVVLHFFYQLFCLFGEPYLSAFYVNAGSTEIFLFVLVVIFLLFSAFAVGEARKIYHLLAVRNADMSYTVPLSAREFPRTLIRSLRTPIPAVCLVVWIVMSIVSL